MSFLNLKIVMLLGCFVTSNGMAVEVKNYRSESVKQLQQLVNERSGTAESATERYQLAKANAWLSYANHEYSERGFTSAGKDAFAQAEQLLHQTSSNLVTNIISPSQVMRRDLWWQIEYLKQRGALDAEPQALANAEVMLVWAAAEYCELGWHHAREHFIVAERQLQKVIYALPQEKTNLNWDEAQVPELSELNGTGCQGVNTDLWPLRVTPSVTEPNITIENVVHFAVDQSILNTESKVILGRIASLLVAHPEMNITLKGYTDTRASVAYNLALSQRRIDSVRTYLIQQGVATTRIAEQAKGKSDLIDNQEIVVANAKSRRVVIYFNDTDMKSITVQPQWRDLQLER